MARQRPGLAGSTTLVLTALLALSAVAPPPASASPGTAAGPTGGSSAPEAATLAGPTARAVASTGGSLAAPPVPTLELPASALRGEVSLAQGELDVSGSDRGVLIEVFDPQRGWEVAARGRTDAAGAFSIPLRPERLGRLMLRATTTHAAKAPTSEGTPTASIEVYRAAVATIFGAGSYGTRTACGEILTPQLLGVAHLTLPCGTRDAIVYGGRSITVPVVDRGPYVSGRSYDLTTATARAIGFTTKTGVATIGASAAG